MKRRVERYELVVVGGGQAGLAAGYWLARRDIDFVILDAGARVGDVWRSRWDSLRLFTPARYSALPGLRFPGDPCHFPSKHEVGDYLEWYARVFELPVRNGTRVSRVRRNDRFFEIVTDGTVSYQSDNLIVATGPFSVPAIPALAATLDPTIMQVHSSGYRNPAQLPDGDVLVVGAANSGAQIALELARSRNVTLAGPAVGHLPRRILGGDVFDWLWPTLMRPSVDTLMGRRIRSKVLPGADRLIGMSEGDLRGPALRRVGRVVGERGGRPVIADGSLADVRSIVWCTGFRPDLSWLELPVARPDGAPRQHRGISPDVTGLGFLGLRFQSRLGSSLIGGVGEDAKYVADAIMARYGETRRTAEPTPFRGTRDAVYI